MFENTIKNFLFVGAGIWVTFVLLIGGLAIGIAGGLCMAILRHNMIAVFAINRFVSVLRGTPLILQLGFVYFSLPSIVGVRIDILTAGVLTFGINSAAYLAEIFRAGIESVPKGQFEAAKSLEISTYYTWKDIVLPQAIRSILPALTSEAIALLKETAIVSTIGGMDIMRRSQVLAAEQFSYFVPLCIAGCYYYMMVLLIEYFGRSLEKRLQQKR